MKLTGAQIAAYAAAAGFPDPVTAAAIALAESGGDPNVVGDLSLAPANGPSYGLWQINVGSSANPQFAALDLADPQTNANAAFALYSAAGGFTPWTTYGSGAYQAFLGQIPSMTPAPASAFSPATSVMTLLPPTSTGNLASATDVSTIVLALALAAGVLFAFSEA